MEKNKDYIYLNKHLLKYLNDISIDFLFLNSKFTNTQESVVYIENIKNNCKEYQINCPSEVYSYKRGDIIYRLLTGKYYNFHIPNTQNIINEILDGLFNYYQKSTTNNITFDDLEDFYGDTYINGFFLKINKNKVKYSFNNYFDKVLYNQKSSNNKPNTKNDYKVGDWVVRTNTGEDTLPIFKKGTLLQIKSIFGDHFNTEQDKGLTNHFFKSVRKATSDEIPSKQKTIEKWSVGSYVVFLKDLKTLSTFAEKGNIDKIIKNKDCIILEKFRALCHLKRENDNQIRWFATYQEAAKFSKDLAFFKVNKITDITISSNPCVETEFPKTPHECVQKASKRNRKLLLL